MSRLRLVEQASAPGTPGTNECLLYMDSSSNLSVKNDAGTVYGVGGSGVLTIPATGTAALIGTQQTYTAAPIFGAGIATATIYATSISMIDDAISSLSSWTPLTSGLLVVVDASGGHAALFVVQGGANAVVEILDTTGHFTANSPGTDTKMNVYYSSGYKIENKRGYTSVVRVICMGA